MLSAIQRIDQISTNENQISFSYDLVHTEDANNFRIRCCNWAHQSRLRRGSHQSPSNENEKYINLPDKRGSYNA